MLTNILLILILVSGVIYLRYTIVNYYCDVKESLLESHNVLYDELESIRDDTNNILIQYTDRLEDQEQLIAKLKETQAPEAVTDTVNLINEWMNGPNEDTK